MTKREMIKAGAKLVIGLGVETIVTNAVSLTTPVQAMGFFKRMAIGIGSIALSAYVSDKVTEYAGQRIDDVFSEIEKIINEKQKEEATA